MSGLNLLKLRCHTAALFRDVFAPFLKSASLFAVYPASDHTFQRDQRLGTLKFRIRHRYCRQQRLCIRMLRIPVQLRARSQSTICPMYMTPTRSEICLTMDKSWMSKTFPYSTIQPAYITAMVSAMPATTTRS